MIDRHCSLLRSAVQEKLVTLIKVTTRGRCAGVGGGASRRHSCHERATSTAVDG